MIFLLQNERLDYTEFDTSNGAWSVH